jgi:hypothetical protein
MLYCLIGYEAALPTQSESFDFHMSATTIDSNTPEPWLEVVRQKVAAIRFGSVQITVHEGRVTQVESLEKTRFSAVGDDAHVAPEKKHRRS